MKSLSAQSTKSKPFRLQAREGIVYKIRTKFMHYTQSSSEHQFSPEILYSKSVHFMKGFGLGLFGTAMMQATRTHESYWTIETFKTLVSGGLIGGVLSGSRPFVSSLMKKMHRTEFDENTNVNLFSGILVFALLADASKYRESASAWDGYCGGILGLTIF